MKEKNLLKENQSAATRKSFQSCCESLKHSTHPGKPVEGATANMRNESTSCLLSLLPNQYVEIKGRHGYIQGLF